MKRDDRNVLTNTHYCNDVAKDRDRRMDDKLQSLAAMLSGKTNAGGFLIGRDFYVTIDEDR